MQSSQSTTITGLSTIAALWILCVPVLAAKQTDDTQAPQALPEMDNEGETVQRERILQVLQIESIDARELAAVVNEFLRARAALAGESGREGIARERGQRQEPTAVEAVSKGVVETQIITDARTNKLIVQTTNEQDLKDIKALIKELDAPVLQDHLETHSYQVKYSRADEVALVLQTLLDSYGDPRVGGGRATLRRELAGRSGTPFTLRSRQVSIPSQSAEPTPRIVPYRPTNCLLIQAGPEEFKEILNILSKIDVKRRQVLLEVAIVRVGSGSGLSSAIELLAGEPDAEGIRLRSQSTSDQTDRRSDVPEAFFAMMRKGDLPGLVQFLQNHQDSQVLAHPFALTDENEENRIDITETRFVQNTTVQGNQTTLSSQQGEDAGISLSLVPTVSASEKRIRLELDLSISDFAETVAASNILPPKTQSRATSSLTVSAGQIFVMGGLTRSGSSGVESGDKTNLYLLLRPHVVTERSGE